MNPHFFTALFTLLSFGSGFKVQGSGLSWRLRRLFLMVFSYRSLPL